MDIPLCFVDKKEKAVGYCPKEGVLLCAKCFFKHDGHQAIGIEDYLKALQALNQINIIQEASALISKVKKSINDCFSATEAYLSQEKKRLMMNIPKKLQHSIPKKTSDMLFLNDFERALNAVGGFIEINLKALKQLAT